jgi:hypothetical protein
MDPLYLMLEISAGGLFVMAAWLALRRGRLPFLELISAAMFGLLLEEGDQIVFETYHYSAGWILAIDRAPVVIGLTWALLLAGAMRITDALGVRRRWAPFVDSILAISLDLAFDAIAIRMGLWTWRELGATDGWFGVPAGNFYAWLFVTGGFSFMTRWLREAAAARPDLEWLQLLVPVPAWLLLLAGLLPFTLLVPIIDPVPGGGMVLFLIALAAFLAAAGWGVFGPNRGVPNGASVAIVDLRLAIGVRLAMHLFFLAGLFGMGLAGSQPMIMIVALALLAAEVPLAMLVASRRTVEPRAASAPRAASPV